jgi:4-amino-4-deoxy-L-arabinose transferase-like glycosyltransferase
MHQVTRRGRVAFVAALAIGLILRIAILAMTADLGTPIADEEHYARIADNIVVGNGFAWGPGQPTSIRPPLYPALLSAVWASSGVRNLQAVRVWQIAIALASTGLIALLGTMLYRPNVGLIAAAVFWLYPSYIFYNFLILTETLFTFLLVALMVLLVRLVRVGSLPIALACGATLGFAALTRSVLWPMPLALCPAVFLLLRASMVRRLAVSALVLAGYAAIVGPWAVRNTRVQGVVTIVDTMGGINLRMGNYEYTPDDRMWDAVMLTGEQNWIHGYRPPQPDAIVTEGMKDKWAQRKAVEYMRQHPAETLRRSFIKCADFWGLERDFVAGVQHGLYSPPVWTVAVVGLSIFVSYVVVVLFGAVGLWLASPNDWRAQLIVLLPAATILAGHTLAFGHARYHLPLIPLLTVFGSALVTQLPSYQLSSRAVRIGALATVTALLTIWVRQVTTVDLPRIKALLDHVG